jgi:hypothetical protein
MFSADRYLSPNRWPVVRIGAAGRTEVVLLSRRFFALSTHWVRSTVPCSGDDCTLCETLPVRGLFYLACMCNGRVSIVELGGLSASALEQHAKLLHQSMRPGLVIELSRKGAKSPVRSEVVREQAGVNDVSHLDLAAHVMALYKFPPPNVGESIESYELRCRIIAVVRNRRFAVSLEKSHQTGV